MRNLSHSHPFVKSSKINGTRTREKESLFHYGN